MSKAVEVKQLSVSYDGKKVVKNVSFSFNNGKLIGIIGPNGAGKSTLLKALLELIPKDCGTITFHGQRFKSMQKHIAYVPQRNNIDWDFPISVQHTVLLGTFPHLGLFRRPKKAEKELAYQCLKQVGMENYRQSQIGELSGGQQQRVFLARALAQQADLFFLDEPFVGIDASSERVIIRILKQLRKEGKTVFVVHHDLSKVEDYFDELILLNKTLIQSGPVETVFQPKYLTKTYDQQFPFFQQLGAGT